MLDKFWLKLLMAKRITPEDLCKSGSEDGEQLALMCWCADNFEKYPELKWLHHSPNGGYRDKREAGKLVAMGTKRGFPDLFLPIPRGSWSGLFIEMKIIGHKNKKDGGATDEQLNWLPFLRSQNFGAIICFGWLEGRKVLIDYLEFK